MNNSKEPIFSLLRSLAVIGLTWLVSSGKLTQDQANTLVHAFNEAWPVLLIVGTTLYGAWKRSPTNVVKAAAKVDGVVVKVDPVAAPSAIVDVANDGAQPKVKIESNN